MAVSLNTNILNLMNETKIPETYERIKYIRNLKSGKSEIQFLCQH